MAYAFNNDKTKAEVYTKDETYSKNEVYSKDDILTREISFNFTTPVQAHRGLGGARRLNGVSKFLGLCGYKAEGHYTTSGAAGTVILPLSAFTVTEDAEGLLLTYHFDNISDYEINDGITITIMFTGI